MNRSSLLKRLYATLADNVKQAPIHFADRIRGARSPAALLDLWRRRGADLEPSDTALLAQRLAEALPTDKNRVAGSNSRPPSMKAGRSKDQTPAFSEVDAPPAAVAAALLEAAASLREWQPGPGTGPGHGSNAATFGDATAVLVAVSRAAGLLQRPGGRRGAGRGGREAGGSEGLRDPRVVFREAEPFLTTTAGTARDADCGRLLVALCNMGAELPEPLASRLASRVLFRLRRDLEPIDPARPRVPTAPSAVLVAHSLTRLGRNREAAAVLKALIDGPLTRPWIITGLNGRNLSGLLWTAAKLCEGGQAQEDAGEGDFLHEADSRTASSPSPAAGPGPQLSLPPALLCSLVDRMEQAVRGGRGDFAPADAGYSLWALARLLPRGSPDFTRALAALDSPLRAWASSYRLPPLSNSMVLWAMGQMGQAGEGQGLAAPLARALAEYGESRGAAASGGLPPQCVTNALWGLAKMEQWPEFHDVSRALLPSVSPARLSEVTVCNLLWSHATANKPLPPALLSLLIDRAHHLASCSQATTSIRVVATALWSVVRLGQLDAFDRLLEGGKGQGQELHAPPQGPYGAVLLDPSRWGPGTPQAVPLVLRVMAEAAYDPHPALLSRLEDRLRRDMDGRGEEGGRGPGAAEVAHALYFFADMAVPPQASTLRAVLNRLDFLCQSPDSLPTSTLSGLTWSLAALLNEPGVPLAECEGQILASLRTLDSLLRLRGYRGLDRPDATQLLNALMLLEARGLGGIVRLPPQVESDALHYWRRREASHSPSDFQLSVHEALGDLGLRALLEHRTEDGLVSIDMAVQLGEGEWVALECDGPDHFARNSRKPRGRKTLLKEAILRARGWPRVVRVSVWEFIKAQSREQRAELVRQKLFEDRSG